MKPEISQIVQQYILNHRVRPSAREAASIMLALSTTEEIEIIPGLLRKLEMDMLKHSGRLVLKDVVAMFDCFTRFSHMPCQELLMVTRIYLSISLSHTHTPYLAICVSILPLKSKHS